MKFLKFLQIYNDSDVYLVEDVPKFLKPDVALPTVLQCGQAPDTLDETVSFSSIRCNLFKLSLDFDFC